MNREKIVEAIIRQSKQHDFAELTLRDALKRIRDLDLLALAQDLGIDTDAVLAQEARV